MGGSKYIDVAQDLQNQQAIIVNTHPQPQRSSSTDTWLMMRILLSGYTCMTIHSFCSSVHGKRYVVASTSLCVHVLTQVDKKIGRYIDRWIDRYTNKLLDTHEAYKWGLCFYTGFTLSGPPLQAFQRLHGV